MTNSIALFLVSIIGLALAQTPSNAPSPVDMVSNTLINYHMRSKPDENFLFSPLSVTASLATLAQCFPRQLLHYYDGNKSPMFVLRMHSQVRWYMLHKDDSTKVSLPFFMNQFNNISDHIVEDNQVLNFHLIKHNYNKDQLKEAINTYVKEFNENKFDIDVASSLDPESDSIVFLSLIYFKNYWEDIFVKEPSEKFTNIDGTEVKPSFMSSIGEGIAYSDNGDFELVKIPMKNSINTYIIIPKDYKKYMSNSYRIIASDIHNAKYERISVHLFMPKFEISGELDLMETFRSVGIDLSGNVLNCISGHKHYVNGYKHLAKFRLDERGTEGAAVTGALISNKMFTETKTVIVNKPFIFFVNYENTNMPLFMGSVTKLQNE